MSFSDQDLKLLARQIDFSQGTWMNSFFGRLWLKLRKQNRQLQLHWKP